MIKAVLFDLGGTLHTSDSPPGRAEWFARRLLDRLADYGIVLEVTLGSWPKGSTKTARPISGPLSWTCGSGPPRKSGATGISGTGPSAGSGWSPWRRS